MISDDEESEAEGPEPEVEGKDAIAHEIFEEGEGSDQESLPDLVTQPQSRQEPQTGEFGDLDEEEAEEESGTYKNSYHVLLTLEKARLAVTGKVVLVTGLGQSKAVLDSHPEPIIPLFHAIVTVAGKWLYIQPIAI